MKKLFVLLFVFMLGVSVTALSYDTPLRNKLFYGFNTSYPVVATNKYLSTHKYPVQVKLPVPASYALLRR